MSRSAEGGAGYAKAAGNYGCALYPSKLAQEQGYHQLIWTDAQEHKYIEESGTMNVMFVIGKLLTPSLSNSILAWHYPRQRADPCPRLGHARGRAQSFS